MVTSKTKLIRILAGTFLLMMSSSVVSNSTTYFITAVTSALNCTRTEFSLYYTVLQICTAVMSLMMGSILRKCPLRAIFIVGCLGTSSGFIIMSYLQNLTMVYIGAAIIGIFQTLIIVPVVSVVNSWFHEHNGLAIGITMSATGFGGIMMAQIMPRIVAGVNWRTGYLVCAALYFIISGVALILAGGKAPEIEDEKDKYNTKETMKNEDAYSRAIKSPMLWIVILCCLVGDGASMNAQHLSAHLEEQSLSITMIATVMSLFSITLAFCKILEGYLYGKLGSKIFIPILFTISICGYLLLTTTNMISLLTGILCFGFAGAMITAVYPLIMREIYGAKLASSLWGFCWAAIACGNSIFTPIIGRLYDTTGSYNTGYYMSATITFIVGIIFYLRLAYARKEKEQKFAVDIE